MILKNKASTDHFLFIIITFFIYLVFGGGNNLYSIGDTKYQKGKSVCFCLLKVFFCTLLLQPHKVKILILLEDKKKMVKINRI